MRKFNVPSKSSKKAYPRAIHQGKEVMVRGVERLDEAQRVYYNVKEVGRRRGQEKAVRCDKLLAV
jgi:hypothetical protein